MPPEEPEKVLLLSHRATGLLAENEGISPASDGLNQKWNRQRVYPRSEGSTQMRLTPSVDLTG